MKKFDGMILACDMDGTLLDSSRMISKENAQALRYFTEEGGRFTLATDAHRRRLANTSRFCRSMRRTACSTAR